MIFLNVVLAHRAIDHAGAAFVVHLEDLIDLAIDLVRFTHRLGDLSDILSVEFGVRLVRRDVCKTVILESFFL